MSTRELKTLSSAAKILPLEELARQLDVLRGSRRIVHCHGVFDLLHIGHIRHFTQARKMGDILVVTLTPDRHVNKGPHRPAFTESLRAEALAALDVVDFVAVNAWPTAVETLGLLRPHVYVKGAEYRNASQDCTGGIAREEQAVREAGGRLAFTDDITFSSSTLLNQHFSLLPPEVQEFIADYSARHRAEETVDYLRRARDLKVLVVGETIIDEYVYCDTLGKSGKEPILAAKYLHTERFAGGVLAVANQVAALSDHVSVLSFLGTHDTYEDFVAEHLNPAITPTFLRMEGAPTIVKRRFVEAYPFQKLFEVYVMNGSEGSPDMSRDLDQALKELLPRFDVVIVVDYGHGMIDQPAMERLCAEAKFLAVNTQVNAGNHGFNTISKYRRADFISISEKEVRLEARSRQRDLREIIRAVADKLACGNILISQGKQGCLCYQEELGFTKVPALSSHIVDRIGAGDAVLSVASLCVALGAPMEVAGFIGNAVGAQAVATVCNKEPVNQAQLIKHLVSLLK